MLCCTKHRHFYLLKALKIKVLGTSSQNSETCCLATEGLFVITRDTEEKMWFDNEIESYSTATEKLKFRSKKAHTCMHRCLSNGGIGGKASPLFNSKGSKVMVLLPNQSYGLAVF